MFSTTTFARLFVFTAVIATTSTLAAPLYDHDLSLELSRREISPWVELARRDPDFVDLLAREPGIRAAIKDGLHQLGHKVGHAILDKLPHSISCSTGSSGFHSVTCSTTTTPTKAKPAGGKSHKKKNRNGAHKREDSVDGLLQQRSFGDSDLYADMLD